MKPKTRSHIINSIIVVFSVLTVLVIIAAYRNREKGELIYLIFNTYALIAVLLSFLIVLFRQRAAKRRQESKKKRLQDLTRDLSSPAMLWDDSFQTVILNDTLLRLADLTLHDDFDAKQVVALFFGRKTLTADDIRELVYNKNREYTFTAGSGQKRDMIWNTSSVETDESGVTWYLSIGLDLADIRLMQSELENYSKRLTVSEGKHNLMMELMDVGILLIEQGNPKLYPSDKLRQMLGLPNETFTVEEMRKRVYPTDIVTFDNHCQTMRNRMKDFIGKTENFEIRLSAADGQYRWFSYRFRATQNAETGRLAVGGTVIDITKEKEKDAQIMRIAYEDSVTGIPNRQKLMQMGHDLYQCTVELQNTYWVIVIDIDRFHLINDTCGYAAGNELLKQFAETMNQQLSLGGFGARISGDNFALILRNTGDDSLPEKVIGRIQRVLSTKAVGRLSNTSLTCSAGYALMPEDGESFEKVLEHAEFALSSQSRTPGSISRYTEQMHDDIIQESSLESRLSEAVMRNELVLYYQPKVSLETGAVIGLEALIRWQISPNQMISPELFIPIAEKSQLITQITRFVMDEACRQTKLWQTIGLPEIIMSINFSSMDFYQENICEQIQKTLEKYKLDPRYLEIELTESLALRDIDLTIDRMNQLRAAGIRIAMDDFGTGYSSLSYIQRLPFTMVKMDRSFVMHMVDDPVVQEIVSSVARIAKAKQIQTIAEGVETPEQARLLRASGCDYVQGFLYGHPMTAKETEQFIRNNIKNKMIY
ncbi:MAG: EAL domain-containing protein [Oscillospiraceae bacterium]|nr:EAL domain-containing protein [Oscillospiraceae bacterium]